ncbi:hypothetical protein LZ575_03790 [Antarcticibacterium sp. 1MA-6-2]|uniref:hypothetical protein n=1 Tax=Antarcticibacterium sp. 1MA-6-2 TaxID=2908210 RepID=UPI001F162380|nr:hypothetical protein [Antarcticibacterium sp. 1MA-6-2]UJH91798.1 hypothetical protein LZ575_03790 [Antarcticibacterium sp. 1MA-6-2]
MRKTLILLCILFSGFTFGQNNERTSKDKDNSSQNSEIGYERPSYYNIQESSDYTFNDEKFRFTPDEKGINIFRIENNKEIPIGKLRRTTSDGFYIMTTTADPDISFGRFDQQGNFRTYKYDRAADRVTEEDYYNVNPRDIRGDNRSERARERSNNDKNQRNKNNPTQKSNSNNSSNNN